MTRIEMFEKALADVKSDIKTLNKCKAMLRKMKATFPNPIVEVIDEMIENQTFHAVDLDDSIRHEKNLAVS